MKKLIIAIAALIFASNMVYASDGYEYKGSHSGYDVGGENAIMNMIQSQLDTDTQKIKIGGKLYKFEYFSNHFSEVDDFVVASVFVSDNKDKYAFDYYVKGNKVVKIMLYLKNGEVINKQVYPEEKEADTNSKK